MAKKKAKPVVPSGPAKDGGKLEYERARELQKLGKEDPEKLEEALEAYQNATTLPGCPPNAYYYMGWLQCKINGYQAGSEKAMQAYTVYLMKSEKDSWMGETGDKIGMAKGRYNLGYLFYLQNETERAMEEWRAALELDPTHSNARVGLANLLKDADMDIEGEAIPDTLLRAIVACAYVYMDVCCVGAMEEYELVLKHDPDHGWGNYWLAVLLMRNKKEYQMAAEKFRKAIDSGSVKNASVYLLLGRALLQSRRPGCGAAAKETYEQGNAGRVSGADLWLLLYCLHCSAVLTVLVLRRYRSLPERREAPLQPRTPPALL
jgi:Tfp pilus assembly protein PilF